MHSTHSASQYVSNYAAPVVDSSSVNYMLYDVSPLLGPGMRVSRVDTFGLTLSYPLMPGQTGKTLTLPYLYGSEHFFLPETLFYIFQLLSIDLRTYSGYRAPTTLSILERPASRGRVEEWNLLKLNRPGCAGASWLGNSPIVALCRFILRIFQTLDSVRWSQVPDPPAF